MKRTTILALEFLAGLAGNLVAGWIQQDIFSNVFSSSRVIGTIAGVVIMLLLITWLEKPWKRTDPKRSTLPTVSQLNSVSNNLLRENNANFDVFISHAPEDKDDLVRPLAIALENKGYRVWYDEFTLKIGDSLRASIDMGLSQSNYGIVVLSKAFFKKGWPMEQLNGLFARQMTGKKVILPIWHQINREEIMRFSPLLADKLAIQTNSMTIEQMVENLSTIIDSN
ncbi:toll/interleukin-1 receptor domain-containing protein [Candidatus Leptofilum sp.]|uniref:toll/interleukin-1 receptor domain-containing protein n=1 Tax=Candidatus Leptofilum sp. TaxID=3241576 RepID=UPI003B59EA74